MYRGYTTNNLYTEFPPLMIDGRTITSSYNPNAVLTEAVIREENIQSNWEYRNFMTRNADKIRRFNYLDSLNDMGYTKTPASVLYGVPAHSAVPKEVVDENSPYLYKSIMDKTRAARDVFPEGDLKNLYLSREELNARKVAPVVTQEQAIRAGIAGGEP